MPVETHVRRTEGALLSVAAFTAAEAVAIFVWPGDDGPVLGAAAGELSEQTGLDLAGVLAQERAQGAAGEVTTFPVAAGGRTVRCLLVGVGDGSAAACRRAGAALAQRLRGTTRGVVELDGSVASASAGEALRAFVEGLLLASYEFSYAHAAANGKAASAPVKSVDLVTTDPARAPEIDAAISTASTTAQAVALARDLINTPSATKTPDWLAGRAAALAGDAGLTVHVRAEEELRAEGFGGILAVGAGSVHPPRLIEMSYEPAESHGHMVLVGKGITFDSGGLSLKPNDNMKLMKTDMAGGAAVMAALTALRALGVPYRVTGLIAAAENMPSGSAQRPGDVITHYGGRTSEVFNTDAEGRLVLADALAYSAERLAPDAVVDLATLTGAATVALGRTHGALYATDDTLGDALVAAGEAGGDRLWRMPLVEDYRPALESDVADLSHIARSLSGSSVGAGSVLAALFLREFAGGVPWAHLDIAGPARATADKDEVTQGGTGFGVRALLRWLAPATDPEPAAEKVST